MPVKHAYKKLEILTQSTVKNWISSLSMKDLSAHCTLHIVRTMPHIYIHVQLFAHGPQDVGTEQMYSRY
jgi:hypothetical protein